VINRNMITSANAHENRGPCAPIVPMTLGNMRQHGVRSLAVSCSLCHHQAVIDAARWPDAVPVPTFGPKMVCTRCGIVGADARPNWKEHHAQGAG